MVLGNVLISFFYTLLSSVPSTTYCRDYLFSTEFFASFVKDKMPIGVCGLSLVLLVHISVFVPVPYSLDDCSFVVLSQVNKVDSSSSTFLSQDFFGSSASFLLPYKLQSLFVLVLSKMPSIKACISDWDRNSF